MPLLSTSRAEPHYGWADVVGDSTQLLSIQPRVRPPGVYPTLDFVSSKARNEDEEPDEQPSSQTDDPRTDEPSSSL